MFAFAAIVSALAILPCALSVSHEVQVGAGGALEFSPSSLSGVADGDTINFTFNPKNHTVTQSTFNSPCNPSPGGFDTGFVSVTTGTTVKSFTIPAGTGTNPLWFFCSQTTHCQQGMVFAVNPPLPPSTNTFDAFKNLAMGLAGLTSDSGTATLGSHNPSTASGSLFTAASVNDGATGSVTDADKPTTTTGPTGTGVNSAGSASPSSTGKTSGAVSASRVKDSALVIGAVFFGLVVSST